MIELPSFFKEEIHKTFVMQLKAARDKCERCNREGIIRDDADHSYYDCPECTGKLNAIRPYIYSNIKDSQFYRLRRDDMKSYLTDKCWENYLAVYNNIIKILDVKSVIIAKTETDNYGIVPAAVVLLKKLIYYKNPAFMVKFDMLVETFFAFKEGKEGLSRKEQMLEYYLKVPYLMIENYGDDFVNPTGTKDNFITQKIMQFMQSRQSNNGKTILALNIPYNAFLKKYDDKIKEFFLENYLTFMLETVKKPQEQSKDILLGELGKLFVTKPKAVKLIVPKKAS